MKFLVVGHARSGTTVLQNALNTAPQVYLLGEADAYLDAGVPDFRRRYNAMHRSYGNQITKSTYAPLLPGLEEDASLGAYLEALGDLYPISGEKVAVVLPKEDGYARLAAWIERHRPYCLYVFRDPFQTIASSQKMFPQVRLEDHVCSYAMTVRHYLDTLRTLPNVRHLVHEVISAEHFAEIGQDVGVRFDDAYACYKAHRISAHEPLAAPASAIAVLEEAYEFLRGSALTHARVSPAMLQLEEKLEGEHGSPLGKLYRQLNELILGFGDS